MIIDLTKPFTAADVAILLGSKDNTRNRQIRVTKDGKAYLSDVVGNREIDGLAFRLETFGAGNGFTGEAAASNTSIVNRIEKALRENWPDPTDTYIDFF